MYILVIIRKLRQIALSKNGQKLDMIVIFILDVSLDRQRKMQNIKVKNPGLLLVTEIIFVNM